MYLFWAATDGDAGAVDDDSRAQIVGLSESLDSEDTEHTINGKFHGVPGNYGVLAWTASCSSTTLASLSE